jgi:hypothetical protein
VCFEENIFGRQSIDWGVRQKYLLSITIFVVYLVPRDKMLVEKSFHRLYNVPSGTLYEMEKIHISYLTARKKCDISIFYRHFVPDGTKIEQDYTTFD